MNSPTARGALYAAAAYLLGAVVVRPWMDRWGSTAEERALRLAGDEFVPDAEQQTHAITSSTSPWVTWYGPTGHCRGSSRSAGSSPSSNRLACW